MKASGESSSSLGPAGLFFVTEVQSRATGERRLEVGTWGRGRKQESQGGCRGDLLKAPSVRSEVSSVNGSSGRPEAGMKQGERSCQGDRLAGCSMWLFNFDLLSLRSFFFHLMLCKNWFYLPLIPPSPPVDE